MGNPKRIRKKYGSLKRPWNKTRILSEKDLLEKYGLASKKELRVMDAIIKKKKDAIKRLLAAQPEVATKGKASIINSLNRIGLVSQDASISDVLGLSVVDILERRLETIVLRQGLATTFKQARQFILHGFIALNGRRVRVPGYLVKREEENTINYFEGKKPKVLEIEMKKQPDAQKKVDAKVDEVKPQTPIEEPVVEVKVEE
jgi:small subunit ribosomal protein S4